MNWTLNRKRRKLAFIQKKNLIRAGDSVYKEGFVSRAVMQAFPHYLEKEGRGYAAMLSKRFRLPIMYRYTMLGATDGHVQQTIQVFSVEWSNKTKQYVSTIEDLPVPQMEIQGPGE
jgi:hypothetical protein